MSLTRRGFLSGILAAAAAPAIVKADSLMKIVVPKPGIWRLQPGDIISMRGDSTLIDPSLEYDLRWARFRDPASAVSIDMETLQDMPADLDGVILNPGDTVLFKGQLGRMNGMRIVSSRTAHIDPMPEAGHQRHDGKPFKRLPKPHSDLISQLLGRAQLKIRS